MQWSIVYWARSVYNTILSDPSPMGGTTLLILLFLDFFCFFRLSLFRKMCLSFAPVDDMAGIITCIAARSTLLNDTAYQCMYFSIRSIFMWRGFEATDLVRISLGLKNRHGDTGCCVLDVCRRVEITVECEEHTRIRECHRSWRGTVIIIMLGLPSDNVQHVSFNVDRSKLSWERKTTGGTKEAYALKVYK